MRETIVKERFTPFPVLDSERLILRQLQLTDTDEIFKLRSDREVNRYIPRTPFLQKDEAFAFILKINDGISNNKWIYWGIRSQDKPKLMGTICLWNFTVDGTADVGYEMLPEFCSLGFMTEALARVIEYAGQKLKLSRIEAHTYANNKRSTQLLVKNGFQIIVEPEKDLEYNEVLYYLDLKL
jgi:[ribosomal protein S5]-alanine N-acetyltransferase